MPSKEKLGLGVVGAGARGFWSVGHEFMRRVDDVRVLAFCDIRDDLESGLEWMRGDVAEKNGPLDYETRVVGTIDALLDIPEIRTVFLATPDHLHAEYAEKILDSGRDLLIEKPIATTIPDINRIARASQRNAGRVFVGFCMRYNRLHRRVKELLDSGTIGRPKAVSFQDYYLHGRNYFRGRGRFRKYTGSLLVEKACHSLDLMSWLLGAEPVRACCFGDLLVFRPKAGGADRCRDCSLTGDCPDAVSVKREDVYGHNRDTSGANDLCPYNSEKDNDDTDAIILQYENGAMATYLECFYPPSTERRYSIIGDGGEIWASEERGLIRIKGLDDPQWREETIAYPTGGHRGADPAMVSTAIDFFRGGSDECLADIRAGYTSVLTAMAALRSHDENRIVRLDEMQPSGEYPF